jgi:drug/metabolite transporter (DMT)-like permease
MALSDNVRGAAFMSIAMAAFTFGDTCIKLVSQTVPLWQVVALRGVLTCSALMVLGHLTGGFRPFLPWRQGHVVALRAAFEVGSTVTFFLALLNMPFANVSAVMQSTPLALTLAAALVYREPLGWRRLIAILAGLCGVLIVIRPGPEGFDVWAVLALVTVLFVVGRDLATRRLDPSVPSITVAFWSAASVSALGAILSTRTPWQPVSLDAGVLIVGAAAFVITGYIFAIKVMRIGELGFTAPFRYTALLWAVVISALVFDEVPDRWTVIGSLIVVASGLFTLYRERQLRLRRAL